MRNYTTEDPKQEGDMKGDIGRLDRENLSWHAACVRGEKCSTRILASIFAHRPCRVFFCSRSDISRPKAPTVYGLLLSSVSKLAAWYCVGSFFWDPIVFASTPRLPGPVTRRCAASCCKGRVLGG